MQKVVILVLVVFVFFNANSAQAHRGRRFEIRVENGQFVAQGINTGPDDGLPSERSYPNVIHDHWAHAALPNGNQAFASLPGFDLPPPPSLLYGEELIVTLMGAQKWASPPVMPAAGTIPDLQPLSTGETIFVSFGGQLVDTNSPGSLTLLDQISSQGALDLDPHYEISVLPAGSLYVLEFQVSSSTTSVLPSDTVYAILSPGGANPMEKLHHAALHLESFLGGAIVPEPATCWGLGLGLLGLAGLRSRQRRPAPR